MVVFVIKCTTYHQPLTPPLLVQTPGCNIILCSELYVWRQPYAPLRHRLFPFLPNCQHRLFPFTDPSTWHLARDIVL